MTRINPIPASRKLSLEEERRKRESLVKNTNETPLVLSLKKAVKN